MIYDLNSLNKAQDFPVAYVLNNLKLPWNDSVTNKLFALIVISTPAEYHILIEAGGEIFH